MIATVQYLMPKRSNYNEVGLVYACQPTGARVMARCQARGRRNDCRSSPDHLKQVKNTASALDKEGRLLLTEEECHACLKLHDDTGESNGPFSRKGGKKPWKSRGPKEGAD